LPGPPPSLRLPLLLWILAVATVFANYGGEGAFGYNASGLAWFVPLAWAFTMILKNPSRVVFPLWTWAPWILAVSLFWYQSRFPSLQRTVQLLCPIAIAAAASTCRLGEAQLQRFITMIRGLAVAMIAIVAIKTGILATGVLPLATGLAPQVMTAMVLGSFYAASYAGGRAGDLRWWLAMAAIPVVALTRTAIVATALTLPLTLAPLKPAKRLAILLLLALAGWGLFYTPRIQGKMFRGGSGEMTDVLDKDFADSGRFSMWKMMRLGIREKPWLGHGAGAGELFVRSITSGQSGYPHNDWLLTLFDYGIVGTAAFVVSVLAASAHAAMCARRAERETRLLLLTGVSAFVPFAILMYTDNILVYVSYFGNLQFAILGLAYGAMQKKSGLISAEAAPHA
jgi:O-antigen ligase